jgi:MFS family permease
MTNDLGGPARISWIPVSNTLALAAVAPFCGYLQDIFGKRNITLFGCVCIMVGIIVVATGNSFGAGVAGMSISGAGAAIGELSALAGYASRAPSVIGHGRTDAI